MNDIRAMRMQEANWRVAMPAMDYVASAAATLVFLALSGWTIGKGSLPLFYTDELYFWVNSYGHGPVRRGLVGTLISPLLGRCDPATVRLIAAQLNWAGLAAVIGIVAALLWRAPAGARRARMVLAALLATSPFLGLVAHHIGYPDGLIAAFMLAGGLMMPVAPAWGVAALLVVFTTLHEMAFLLMLPFAIFSSALRPGWRLLQFLTVGTGVEVVLCLALFSNHPQEAVLHRLVSAGLSPETAAQQLDLYIGHGTISALRVMALKWVNHPLNGLLGLAYATLPGLCIMWLGLPFARRAIAQVAPAGWYRVMLTVFYAGSCLSGIGVLLLAWDLSRIGSFTTLTAFMTAILVMRTAQAEMDARAATLSLAIGMGFAMLPVFNLYFEAGWPVRMNLISAICRPCASASLDFIDMFNRDLTPEARLRADTDPVYGNGAMAGQGMHKP